MAALKTGLWAVFFLFVSPAFADRVIYATVPAMDFVYVAVSNPSPVTQDVDVEFISHGRTMNASTGNVMGAGGLNCGTSGPFRACANKPSHRTLTQFRGYTFSVVLNTTVGTSADQGLTIRITARGDQGFLVASGINQCLGSCDSGGDINAPGTFLINGGKPF